MLQKQCFSFLRVCNVCLCKIIIYIYQKEKHLFQIQALKKIIILFVIASAKIEFFLNFLFKSIFFCLLLSYIFVTGVDCHDCLTMMMRMSVVIAIQFSMPIIECHYVTITMVVPEFIQYPCFVQM